jgi:hypothetical protein
MDYVTRFQKDLATKTTRTPWSGYAQPANVWDVYGARAVIYPSPKQVLLQYIIPLDEAAYWNAHQPPSAPLQPAGGVDPPGLLLFRIGAGTKIDAFFNYGLWRQVPTASLWGATTYLKSVNSLGPGTEIARGAPFGDAVGNNAKTGSDQYQGITFKAEWIGKDSTLFTSMIEQDIYAHILTPAIILNPPNQWWFPEDSRVILWVILSGTTDGGLVLDSEGHVVQGPSISGSGSGIAKRWARALRSP